MRRARPEFALKRRMIDEVLEGKPVSSFEIIDCHGHLGRWHHFNIPASSPAEMVRLMDSCGIRAIVSAAHAAIGPDYKLGNDQLIRAMREFPGRIYGYCTVNPHVSKTEMRDELNRCFDAGMIGIKLHPSVHRYPADGENYAPAWQFANELGCCVLSHTAAGDTYCGLGCFEKPAAYYPNAKIIIGHSGFGYEGADQSIQLACKHANIYLDVTASTFYAGLLERLVAGAGAHRVLFGTDLPFMDCRPQVGRFAFSKLDDDQLRLTLGGNAHRLFGI
ncbi:MAG: amidohydrolase family protein [Armatimonadota bacterium]